MARPVAFGKHQRALIIEASRGPAPLVAPGMSIVEAKRRREAAASLERLGIIIKTGHVAPNRVSHVAPVLAVELTDLGSAILRSFEHELRAGKRINWTAAGWEAAYQSAPKRVTAERPDGGVALHVKLWSVVMMAAALVLSRSSSAGT